MSTYIDSVLLKVLEDSVWGLSDSFFLNRRLMTANPDKLRQNYEIRLTSGTCGEGRAHRNHLVFLCGVGECHA